MHSLGPPDQQDSTEYLLVLHTRKGGGQQCGNRGFHNPDTKGQTEQPGIGTWAHGLSVEISMG